MPSSQPSSEPTKSQSQIPTTSLLPSISPSISLVPSSSPSSGQPVDDRQGDSICDDDPSETFEIDSNGQRAERDCAWLRSEPTDVQTQFCALSTEIFSVCEETCGKCTDSCEDDSTAQFVVSITDVFESQLVDCAWLATRPHMINQFCQPGHDAYVSCEETCNSCLEEVGFIDNNFLEARIQDHLEGRNRVRPPANEGLMSSVQDLLFRSSAGGSEDAGSTSTRNSLRRRWRQRPSGS